ncbi:peptidase M48 Ste24p [Maritimibacter sp. 55A14]|nr:peptidase M48 Ste24p [Maritimibacter sp. 55A14]
MAAGAAGSVMVIIFVLVPLLANQLATLLPPEGEKALGDATLSQIREALSQSRAPLAVCEDADGQAALDAMVARLAAGADLPYPLQVQVLDHGMVNAFALPGGHVILFEGLIDAAEEPEEVAAVLAHEIGHVAARDPARIALRTAGSIGVLGLLLGDFAGGSVVLLLTERLIQANYTRAAETAADDFAHGLLKRAGMPPEALGAMFRRLREKHGDAKGLVAHFASHPRLADRIAAAERAGDAAAREPALTEAQWQAFRGICD